MHIAALPRQQVKRKCPARRAKKPIWKAGAGGQLSWVRSRTESRSGCNMESSKEGMDDDWTEAVYDLQVLQPRILEQLG